MSGFGIRRRLLITVVATVGVALVVLVAAFNLILAQGLDRDSNSLVRSRAAAQLASLRVVGGRLNIGEAPDDRAADAYVWVFAGTRAIERPRVGRALDLAARSLATGQSRFREVSSTDTRLYSAPLVAHGRRVGTVVAGVSLAPYEQTRKSALLASLIFGAIVLGLVALAAHWLLAHSLRPVVRMTRQAADWSEHAQEHRFALGAPHDELTELAATLDALLDRVAASLRHEQRFSAELSHELRTPLARLLVESELALRREREPEEYRKTLELVHQSAHQLARTVDALVAAARFEAGDTRGTADAHSVASGAAAGCAGLATEHGVELEVVQPARELRVGVDADLAERILQPIVENACRYGETRVSISVRRDASAVLYTVEDDGPGVAAGEEERIFEPGSRGDPARRNGEPGAGLGLALSRRLARAIDGDIVADVRAGRGRFLIRLPAG